MDFIDWCDRVLHALSGLSSASVDAQTYGVDEFEIANALSKNLESTECGKALADALSELRAAGLAEENGAGSRVWQLGDVGRRHIANPNGLWNTICAESLDFAQHKELIETLNELSPQPGGDCVSLEFVEHATLVSRLSWAKDFATLRACAMRLKDIGFATAMITSGSVDLQSTYRGLVWGTRCVKSKVFLSYRRSDSEAEVLYFAEHLEPYGINVFVDTRKMEGTGPFPPELDQAITGCDVFLCFLGRTTLESEWVRHEIEVADRLGKPAIPILQADYKPPEGEQPAFIKNLLLNKGVVINSGYFPEAVAKVADRIRVTWYRGFEK